METPAAFVSALAAARIGATFNFYRDGARAALLRRRLIAYLEARGGARVLLVGEAAGFRGARISGLPFTSERQLSGAGPAEATATIVRGALRELELEDDVLLWNVVPTHPHLPGRASSNRPPTRPELGGGAAFVEALAAGRTVVPVGRVAERTLRIAGIRHPSHGGAALFRAGLAARLAR